jgi:hypothetical protein
MRALRNSPTFWATTPLLMAAACASLLWPLRASADAVGYLVNVTVRPGYGFADAYEALAYGHSLCDKVAAGEDYGRLVDDVIGDFNADPDFQAAYLVGQAVNVLCPQLIWQLRNSAAHYGSQAPTMSEAPRR